MKPEQQRIAIAEACGLHRHPNGDWVRDGIHVWFNEKGRRANFPDYLTDLNVMHEALSTLNDHQGVTLCFHLNEMGIFGEWDILKAPLEKLNEAFLRTLGKWVES